MASKRDEPYMPDAFSVYKEPARPFPVIQSLPSPQALVTDVLVDYELGDSVRCKLLAHNLNDTYLVSAAGSQYILRVSQAQRPVGRTWRTASEILYELNLLQHLGGKGTGVAIPCHKKDGTLLSFLQAPEGQRVAALFTYAHGEPVTVPRQTPSLSTLYGRSMAEIHAAADDFTSDHPRFQLDLAFLLDIPLQTIQPLLIHRPEDWKYLLQLADFLKERLAHLSSQALDRGACHGDATGGNAVLAGENRLTFFDFDVCGAGYRAYDLAVFYWAMALGKSRLGWDEPRIERLWSAYLEGYLARRTLGELDLQAIPLFVLCRQFWFLGINMANWDYWGVGEIDDRVFDRELTFLREWFARHIG